MKLSRKILVGASACLMVLSLSACGNSENQSSGNGSSSQTEKVSEPSKTNGQAKTVVSSAKTKSNLANLTYKSGTQPWTNVNHGKSTLNPKSWSYDHVVYANLDHENRTSTGNTGYLDKNNIANEGQRTRQVVKPTGWHQKFVNGSPIINRGHEIAYSLSGGINQQGQYKPGQTSGDQNNPKNLFTQSAFSNQKVQTIYETKVRHALESGEKVIYQVTPIFKGRDLMARGVQMQAVSTDHKLNFNVYLFNVQPNVSFNYANGRSTVDNGMSVNTPTNDNYYGGYHSYNGYGRYGRHHHFVRHAVEGYALYRIGKHVGRKRSERTTERETPYVTRPRRRHVSFWSRLKGHHSTYHPRVHYNTHPHFYHSSPHLYHHSSFHFHSRL